MSRLLRALAFAAELSHWTGRKVLAIHHGFDHEAFTRDSSPLASEVEEKLRRPDGSFKLLFVSHYNYYRNFETLISSTATPARSAARSFGQTTADLPLGVRKESGSISSPKLPQIW